MGYLVVNEAFDKEFREEMFWDKKDVKAFFDEVAGMKYVISAFFKSEEPKAIMSQFNANAVIGQYYVMNNDKEGIEENYLEDFFNVVTV